jgi:hypothetical protein
MVAARRGTLRAWLLLVCLPLAACLDAAGEAGPDDALRAVAFYDGDVTVTGPRGYCVDRSSIKSNPGGRFALLASCESLTEQAGIAVAPAVMTVSVLPRAGGAEQPSAAAMAEALGPEAVRSAEDHDGLALVHVAGGGDTVLINGHLVGLAAYGPAGGVVAGPEGRRLLRGLAEAMRGASLVPETVSRTASEAPGGSIGRGTLFGGLFPVSN